ncbi:MAG: adenylate/guanylate cyclase domain-containing protein [Hyphomicrobiales bacterium]
MSTIEPVAVPVPATFALPDTKPGTDANDVVMRALSRDKREGLQLSVRARWAALALIAPLLVFLNPTWGVVYYLILLVGFAAIGWAQLKIGRVGQSRLELFVMFCDLALMTFALIVPNPLSEHDWPATMQFRFNNFSYFYVLLAGATLAYSWRTIFTMGTWTALLWVVGVAWVVYQPVVDPELSERLRAALGGEDELLELLDPNTASVPLRIQEIVVFLIVAGILALGGWRANRLLMSHAAVERERTNLARYFSPNVVEELSQNDDPLKQIRTQNVAVLFVDIVGFTRMADGLAPAQVIEILRQFHGRMEREVFRHNGTLDKYLGDGLMATFGTPSTAETDAGRALRCVRDMCAQMDVWNAERAARGEPAIQASFGLHYGQAVLGDIGANRLEFAVIGATVNVASRLEALTRELKVVVVASDALIAQARREPKRAEADFVGLERSAPQSIRGVAQPMVVWTMGRPAAA